MRNSIITTAVVLALASFATAQDTPPKPATPAPPATPAVPESTPENVNYAFGILVAQQLKQLGVKPDAAAIAKALTDIEAKKATMTAAQCQQVLQKAHQAHSTNAAGRNKEEGVAYLAKNAKKEGVTTTASGLQYEVLKKGEGEKPTAADSVKVHYHGTLLDGTVFDSSVERGEPISFPLNGVIKGWTEGLQLMPTGSKFKFTIPGELAYGERGGPGGEIGPNATLVFEVELLAVEKK